MPDTQLWRLVQSWMDGQIVRVNQSQLADALGVNRQSLTQWKQGQARPSPTNLRALRRVTRIDWALLTDALLRDMGYTEEDKDDGNTAATIRAGASPAELEAMADQALAGLTPQEREELARVREGLRGPRDR